MEYCKEGLDFATEPEQAEYSDFYNTAFCMDSSAKIRGKETGKSFDSVGIVFNACYGYEEN